MLLKIKHITVFLLMLMLSLNGYAQSNKFFGSTYYSGELGASMFYKYQRRVVSSLEEKQKNTNYAGGLLFNSQVYFWTPNFFLLDINLGYSPISEQNLFLVSPDRNETRTLKKLDLKATLLANKPIMMTGHFSINENFAKRDLLTDVRFKSRSYGGMMILKNKILPLTFEYQDKAWSQREIGIDREAKNFHQSFRAQAEKEFSEFDKTIVKYHYYDRKYEGYEGFKSGNISHILDLSNVIEFDTLGHQSLRSKLIYTNQIGSQTFNRSQLFENVNFNLPNQFKFFGEYQYMRFEQPLSLLNMHNAKTKFTHKLYASLDSEVFYWYTSNKQLAFNEKNHRIGGSLHYTKKIPTGNLRLYYNFYRLNQRVDQKSKIVNIIGEDYILSDNRVVFLDNPFVELETIRVTDPSGLILYELNLDYILITQGDFIEIQRVPGGPIANGSLVLIDYIYHLEADYSFTMHNHGAGATVSAFNRILNIYLRLGKQRYQKVDTTSSVVLNPFNQISYGFDINYKNAKSGIDYEDHIGNINSYKMLRIYVQISGFLSNKIQYSVLANRRYMNRVTYGREEVYSDIYGTLIYSINDKSKVNFNIGYRNQEGRELDLNLITARVQYSTSFRLLLINVGAAAFRREYLDEEVDYNSFYVQLMRRF